MSLTVIAAVTVPEMAGSEVTVTIEGIGTLANTLAAD